VCFEQETPSHEAILSAFPSMSPLTAQVALSMAPLRDALRLPLPLQQQISKLLPAHLLSNCVRLLKSTRPYSTRKGEQITKFESKLTLNPPKGSRGQTTIHFAKK
jgi:hypothetical protein